MRELSVAEQRYQAVLAVIADGRSVSEVAGQWRVSRQTLHTWLARYEAEGLTGLADRSHRRRYGFITCGKGQPGQSGWMTHAASHARFRQVQVIQGQAQT